MSGVRITAQSESTKEVIAQLETDSSSSYKIGPLYDNDKYKVVSHDMFEVHVIDCRERRLPIRRNFSRNFQSFEISKNNCCGNEKKFTRKFIFSQVKDQEGNGLPKVVLTLSGDTIRNNVTNSNGQFIFYNLVGGQYYLKPNLKEYLFTPNSQVVMLVQLISDLYRQSQLEMVKMVKLIL